MNKIIAHYCGGAGINIARDINTELDTLGNGFCSIVPRYIDTSTNNAGEIDHTEIWKVSSNDFSSEEISGSGGERRANSVAIMDTVKEYLDHHKHSTLVTGEFHIVVFSGSGGSGSVLGPTLIRNLRSRGIPVIGVMIGDSSNGLSCKNTLNTIATLDHMAKKALNKPVVMLYYNNHTVAGGGVLSKENAVNKLVFNALSVMSLFLSGDNEDIDTKDMINFLSPDNYQTITIAPSLYCITIHTNDVVVNDDKTINLIGRTLTTPGQDTDVGVVLLQHKYGKVISPDAVITAREIAPVHIILTGNYLLEEHKLLTNTVAEYESIGNSVITEDLAGSGDADDDGMIF